MAILIAIIKVQIERPKCLLLVRVATKIPVYIIQKPYKINRPKETKIGSLTNI